MSDFPFDQYSNGHRPTVPQVNVFWNALTAAQATSDQSFEDAEANVADVNAKIAALTPLFMDPDVQALPQGVKSLLLGIGDVFTAIDGMDDAQNTYLINQRVVQEMVEDPVLLYLVGNLYEGQTSPNGGEPGD